MALFTSNDNIIRNSLYMKAKILLIGVLIYAFSSHKLYSQLVIAPNPSLNYAVQNVLVGEGVTVSNLSYSGANVAWATFTTGSAMHNLGFTSGILITSGKASEVAQGAGSFASTDNAQGSDAQLASLVSGTIKDRCVLEFDFVPISDTLKFRYVFGSEEYPEYANSNYNDVFGFFISGPNPGGGNYTNYNIARIPGTNTVVSINNINNGTSNSGPCEYCQFYRNNASPVNPHIVYDAMTTVLTATVVVVPCQTYHIKLAVGDVYDGIYDTGVFLEANSFSSMGMSSELTFESDIVANSIVSGCSDAALVFHIPEIYGDTVSIHYTFAGSATNGEDYLVFPPDSAIIPPGSDSVTVQIIALPNSNAGAQDTIIVLIPGFGCSGVIDTLYIPIHGNPPITLEMSEDQLLCDGGVGYLQANVTGGIPPFTYTWSNGVGNVNQQEVVPTVTTTYYVTVQDPCGNYAIDSVQVQVGSLQYTISNDTAICSGKGVTLGATFDGYIYWEGYEGNPITIIPNSSRTVNLIMSNVCGTIYDSVIVTVHTQPQIDLGSGAELCTYDSRILQVSSSYESIQWYINGVPYSNEPQITADTNSGSGSYYVQVANAFCTDSGGVTFVFIPCDITIPNVFTPNGDGVNDKFVVENLDNYPYSKLEIFNRWGKKVYSNDDYKNDWTGDNLADGVYYYVLILMKEVQQVGYPEWKTQFSGSVSIVR